MLFSLIQCISVLYLVDLICNNLIMLTKICAMFIDPLNVVLYFLMTKINNLVVKLLCLVRVRVRVKVRIRVRVNEHNPHKKLWGKA